MPVTNILVEYERKRQPAQYESAGARVQFAHVIEAVMGDGDDHVALATKLLGEAKTIVLTELALVAAGQNASAHAPKADAVVVPPAGEGEQRRSTDVKPETAAAKKKREAAEKAAADEAAKLAGAGKPAAAAEVGGIPTDDTPPAGKTGETALGRALPAGKPAEAPGIGDIPVDDSSKTAPTAATPAQVQQAANADALDASKVQKYITTCLVAKKFLPNVVLGKLKNEYKVDRPADLSPENLLKFYNELRALAGEGPA